MKNTKVLLLNADFTPEKLIDWQTALIQDIINTKNSAYTVEYYDEWVIFDSAHREYAIPAVMALKKYIEIGSRKCPYTKTNVYARDMTICQYCNRKFKRMDLTIDHIVPVSKWRTLGIQGTPSCFENVVTACRSCNTLKGNKKPEEVGLKLRRTPRVVTRREVFRNKIALMEHIPNEWIPYLTGIISEIN